MQIFEFEDFKIVADTWQKSTGWGHWATLFYKDNELVKEKCKYYNRTWESWTYQTIILNAIYSAIEQRQKCLIDIYKSKTGATRVTNKIKTELCETDELIIALRRAYEHFKKGRLYD